MKSSYACLPNDNIETRIHSKKITHNQSDMYRSSDGHLMIYSHLTTVCLRCFYNLLLLLLLLLLLSHSGILVTSRVPVIFTREPIFVTSCLLFCAPNPFSSNRKEFASKRSQFLLSANSFFYGRP